MPHTLWVITTKITFGRDIHLPAIPVNHTEGTGRNTGPAPYTPLGIIVYQPRLLIAGHGTANTGSNALGLFTLPTRQGKTGIITLLNHNSR